MAWVEQAPPDSSDVVEADIHLAQASGDMAEGRGLPAVGPIDFFALGFPGSRLRGRPLAALLDLVDAGVIRILDLRVVRRDTRGHADVVTLSDLQDDLSIDLRVFDGVESGLIDDDDLRHTAELVAPGDAAALVVYENAWAGPFMSALRSSGAAELACGRIPAATVIERLDELDGMDDRRF